MAGERFRCTLMLRQVGIQTLNQKPLLPFVLPDRGDSHGDRWPVPGGKGKVESNQSQLAILDKGISMKAGVVVRTAAMKVCVNVHLPPATP